MLPSREYTQSRRTELIGAFKLRSLNSATKSQATQSRSSVPTPSLILVSPRKFVQLDKVDLVAGVISSSAGIAMPELADKAKKSTYMPRLVSLFSKSPISQLPIFHSPLPRPNSNF